MMINPLPITDVTVYPYTTAPIELMPVLENASGTYSIGTLATHVFYNLDLQGGKHVGKFEKGGIYFAQATDAAGNSFRTHWLHCTDDGKYPSFGLTQNLLHPQLTSPNLPIGDGPYIRIERLVDFTTVINSDLPAIGTTEIDLGKSGWLIGTRTGAPHVNGFLIDDPNLPKFYAVGSRNISVRARSEESGNTVGFDKLTLGSANSQECALLQQFT